MSIMQAISSPDAPQAIGPYSQAVLGHGLLFTSGQIPLLPKDGSIAGDSAAEQMEQCLNNLEAVLLAGGSAPDKVVKTTVYLTDMADFAAVNEVYAQHFGTPAPARSCVAVSALPKNVKVEVEAIALTD